jgi:hypothetical protein
MGQADGKKSYQRCAVRSVTETRLTLIKRLANVFRRRFLIPPIPRPSGKLPVYPFNAKRSLASRTFKVLAPLSRSSDRGKRTPQQHDTHTPFRETSAFDHALDRTLPRVFDSRGRGKPHAYDLQFG